MFKRSLMPIEAYNHGMGLKSYKRGDSYKGGRFVGVTDADVVWISWEGTETHFKDMCQRFDELRQRRKVAA